MFYKVMTRKQWNRKTTLQQHLSVFDVFTSKYFHEITKLVKWVGLHHTIAVSHAHGTFKSRRAISEFSDYPCIPVSLYPCIPVSLYPFTISEIHEKYNQVPFILQTFKNFILKTIKPSNLYKSITPNLYKFDSLNY